MKIICGFVIRTFFSLILLLASSFGFCQFNKLVTLKHVFVEKDIRNLQYTGIQNILNTQDKIPNCRLDKENLLLNKGCFYLNPNGTGQLYTLNDRNEVKRIDATCFQGYNFGAIVFFYKDTLYSAGGYGFWNLTGSIRYFDTNSKEWNIIKTNRDIPFANGVNSLSFFDVKKGLLYVFSTDSKPEYYSKRETKELIYINCFDFNKKTWIEENLIVDPRIASSIDQLTIIQYTDNGFIVNIKGLNYSIEIIPGEKNIYQVDDNFITQLIQEKHKLTNYISYTKKDTLYFFDLIKDSIIKINYDKKHKSLIKMNFYKKNKIYLTKETIIYLLTSIIFILILLIVYFKNNNNKINDKKLIDNKIQVSELKPYFESLELQEKEALKVVIQNSINGLKTTVDELNKAIGISKRNYKMQNNIRAEIIALVNKKFSTAIGTKDILIERNRTSFDKRFFEYEINPKYLKKVVTLIK